MSSRTPPKKWQTDDDDGDVESVTEAVNRSHSSSEPMAQDEQVSPAPTFGTSLTPPVTIEHNLKMTTESSPSRTPAAGLILGMSKPALAIATLLILGTGAAAAFGWLQIPGLDNQIEELEDQVAKLSTQVDRLSEENDRFTKLNNELNQTVEDFRVLNQDLNTTVFELEFITSQMNKTQVELAEEVLQLTIQNENYSTLNVELNATATTLAQEVDFFQATVDKLVLENGTLSSFTDALDVITNEIGTITEAQNETLYELYVVSNGLKTENDRLEAANNDLVTVVAFLNDTSVGIGNTLAQITDYLADQIVANQVLTTQSLENTYRQRVQTWDCDYRDAFRDEAYGQNYSVVISDVSTVMDYVDQRVISELCLNKNDFNQYLMNRYPDGLTSYRLLRGVNNYTSAALDYYFPETGEAGLTPAEWDAASYSCQNLINPYTSS